MSFKKILAVVMACFMAFGAFAASALTLDVAEAADETVVAEEAVLAAAALPEAVDGVITLTENVTLDATYVVAAGETLTINLNGFTITGNMHKNDGAVIKNNGTLTLTNGTVTSAADNGGSALANSGTAVVDGATLNGAPNANGSWPSYTVNNTGILTISNSYITSYHGAVASYNAGAVVTLNDTNINMAGIPGFTNHAIYTYSNGKVVVNGGNIANNAKDQGSTGGSVINGYVEVISGTFTGRIENYYGTPSIKGGTFYNVDGSLNTTINTKFIAEGSKFDPTTGVVTAPVANVGNTPCYSVSEALAAAEAVIAGGETTATVKLLSDVAFGNRATDIETTVDGIVFDLNGYTMTLSGDHVFSKNVTFKNGTIAISDQLVGTGVFWVWNADNTLTFDNVAIENAGDSIKACSIFATSSGAPEFVLKNCTINLKNNTFNPDDGANLFYFNNNATNVKIEKTTITIDRFARGLQLGTYDIDDSEITMTNMNGNAIRLADAVITNSTFIAENTENGMKLDGDNDVVIDGDSYVRFLGATNYDIVVSANSTVAVKDDAVLYADKGNIADASTVTGNAVVLADIIKVDFVQVDGDAEGYDLYNINLVGANDEVINRLNSADLTFKFVATPATGAAMDYEIIAVEKVTVTPDTTTPNENRFMFNFKGKDLDVIEGADTAKVITIAQVKVSGYGDYTFSVDTSVEANKNNVVHATTISDNIVDTFVPGGAAGKGTLDLDDATTGEVTIVVPVRTLTVNVTFPNSVEKNDALYQDMKVEITGNIEGVHQTVTHKLGEDEVAMLNGGYVVTEARLVLNETYNVVVTGAGYRTARYTVTMTDSKTVNFWNNVKDNDTVVEEGKHSEKLNFLAGDIVGDNNINIYDLSAVVSYFATSITDEADYETYVKYDLNRDHVIDSKDVAYVLVSWGK